MDFLECSQIKHTTDTLWYCNRWIICIQTEWIKWTDQIWCVLNETDASSMSLSKNSREKIGKYKQWNDIKLERNALNKLHLIINVKMKNMKPEMFVIQIESHSNAIRRCEQQRMEKRNVSFHFQETNWNAHRNETTTTKRCGKKSNEHKLVCVYYSYKNVERINLISGRNDSKITGIVTVRTVKIW